MRKLKKILSILLITAILLPMIPIGEIRGLASGGIHVDNIRINYTYKDREDSELEKILFNFTVNSEIKGKFNLWAEFDDGKNQPIGTINIEKENFNTPHRFELSISKNVRVTAIDVNGIIVKINNPTPKITSMDSHDIELGEELIFSGQNLNLGTMSIDGLGEMSPQGSNKFVQTITEGNPGYKSIKFTEEGTTNKGGDVTQNIIYPRIFKLMGKLDVLGENLEIIPEMGENGSVVYIRTDGKFNVKDGVGEYSVFFLKDGTDKYTKANMAEILSFSQDGKVMKIKVPAKPDPKKNIIGIEDTIYYNIQVTNRVKNPNGNIDEQVLQRKTAPKKFFVIGADKSPVITKISPTSGPDRGEVVKVIGRKFDKIDYIDGLTNSDNIEVADVKINQKALDDVIGDIIGSEGVESDGKKDDVFHISYSNFDGAEYEDHTITSIDRYIATYIGDKTIPHNLNGKPQYKFDDGGFDSISVEVPNNTATTEIEVNVIMMMQTDIVANNITHTIVSIITNDGIKYTITPSHTSPTITKITPDKIQVIKNAGDYGLKEDMVISVEGSNFKVIKSKNNTTGKDATYYPIVGIGADIANAEQGIVLRISQEHEGEVEINLGEDNWKVLPGAKMKIVNEKGDIIDGTINKDTGSKIIINLPRSWDGIKLPTGSVTTDVGNKLTRPVVVRNPILGSSSPGTATSNDNVTVMFVDIGDTPPPTIGKVTPNVTTIDSGEEIIITGTKFEQGVRVFLGGVEVTGVTLSLPGPEDDAEPGDDILKFKAPKFPQIIDGSTKVMVMNLDGGIAVKDFTYVKSLQRDPMLSNFTPKSGSKDTIVVVDGDNFLVPNPSVSNISGIGIYRLIGSRILMDGKDINEYNLDTNGNIELQDYGNGSEILITSDGLTRLASYAHSIILVDENNASNYYNIYENNKGQIILSDGGSGTEETNTINQYTISLVGDNLIADKGGSKYSVTPHGGGLKLEPLTGSGQTINLKMQTPYRANGSGIFGSRVKVIDKNRIEFRVPGLASKVKPGGYTITVENPDTKKATAKDLFVFFETVTLTPTINADGIKPAIGSVDGGYQILIEGENFEDGSKVYVDGVLVPQKDVKRESGAGKDTIIISSMPAYRRDMSAEKIDRKQVPIVVENGDGGTAISRFTYVVPPSAKPIVDSATFQKEKQVGSAAGEEILTISGRYFKFDEPSSEKPKYKGWIFDEVKNRYYEDRDKSGNFTSYASSIDYKEQKVPGSKKGETEKLPVKIENYTEWLSSPVLPTVRIGGIEARIVEFGPNFIRVITPQLPVGRQELYVVNNDFGTSEKVILNFEGSTVKIDAVVPDVGKKQGEDSVEITGSGFQNTRINVIEGGKPKDYTMPLVRFGSVGGTKDINNNMAQLSLEKDDFTLDYNNSDISEAVITMSAKYNNEIYTKTFTIDKYNGEDIFLPVNELRTTEGELYPGYELVKIQAKNRKLIVEKGYSPYTKLDNSGKISLKTPSYYTIGDVQINVTNPDGGNGTGRYKYTNPSSKPKIENVTRDGKDPEPGDDGNIRILRLDYRGGQNITLLGEDFREGTTIKIGDVLSIDNKDIVETLNGLPNKLAFLMPGVDEKAVGNLYRVTVINGDGATVSSDTIHNKWNVPIYIQFIKGESDPDLGDIIPNKGPATGGTKVTIKGKDFRDKMEGYEGKTLTVYFGDVEVPGNNVKIIDHSTLEVIAPPSPNLGPVSVKIENPDGTQTMGNPIFTYISKPKINDMNPKKLFTNDTETVVTITGEQFLPGAKVIVGGKIIPIKDVKDDMTLNGSGIRGVDSLGNNIESSVVDGKETATAIVENDGTIKVTFPDSTDLENTSIIIINPDGGISEPYNDFKHEKPVPLKPMVLEGIPGAESTVRLIWSKSDENILNRSSKYEIYGRKTSDKENTFLGDTTNADFLIKALEPNTEYEFLVRALNEHGAAIDFATVKVKTLSLSEDKKLKEKEEKRKQEESKIKTDGKEEIQGDRLVITLGTNRFKNGLGTLDISLAKYKDKDKLTIAIPIALARTDNNLTIKDGTMTSIINVRDLYTLPVSRLDIGDKDAYLRIHIDRTVEQHIPRGKRPASKAYELYFDYIYGKDSIKINEILRNGKLSLTQDTIVYPAKKNTSIYVFNVETGNYVNIKTMNTDIKGKKKVILLSDR